MESPMPAKQPHPERLLRRREAADRLRVSVRTVDHWIATGKLGSTRLGRLVRIHPSELDRIAREGVRNHETP
ncbi:MAG: helix-turn-helix domain-containing protein [Planctomycetota bacterium]